MERTIFDDEHDMFRTSFRRFIELEITPHYDRWENAGIVDRSLFRAAGNQGFLALQAPPEYGGGGSKRLASGWCLLTSDKRPRWRWTKRATS